MLSRRQALGAAAAVAASPAVARSPSKPGFLWGVASAAHVSEGGNVNADYWLLEHLSSTYFKEPSGDANDSFNRWREDLALVAAGGMNSYRFSVEWARIEPERGEFSAAMLAYYRGICVACRELGIEPVVTFHHFTSPRWIAALGGWENPETAGLFARYCERTARALAGSFGWACTINEPNAQVTSQAVGNGKPWAKWPAIQAEAKRVLGSDRFGAFFLGDAYRVRDVCLAAHAQARDAIRSANPGTKVGMTLALQDLSPGPGGEAVYRRIYDHARAPFYAAAAQDDFIGVQTYNRMQTGPDGYLPAPPATADGWSGDAPPGALAAVAREAHAASRVPVFVTEHGINTGDDALRIRHRRASVELLAGAIDSGLPVVGYMHFGLVDTWEWTQGFGPQFGMVAIDRATFRRTPRPSLAAYRPLIAAMRARHAWA